jgi:membrane protein
MRFDAVWALARESFSEWREDKASRLAAALAYYTMFSIPPLLIVVLAILGQVFEREAAQDRLAAQINALIGRTDVSDVVTAMIEGASRPRESAWAAAVGVVTLMLGASGVFAQLQDALNTIWEVEPRPGRGILGVLRDRVVSFGLALGVGFLLLVSLVLSAGLAILGEFFSARLPLLQLGMLLELVISFGVTSLLFALIFKVIPDVRIGWRDVWLGAVLTAALFSAGKWVLAQYLATGITTSYGAAGSLVLILAWVYYSAQILFLGAEFTQVYANRYGSGLAPDRGAVPVADSKREQQGMRPASQ